MAQEADLEFPYELVRARGVDALSTWQRLRSEGRGWPLVLGGPEDLERLTENLGFMQADGRAGPVAVAAAANVRFPGDLRTRRAADLRRSIEHFRTSNPDLARQLEGMPAEHLDPPRGEWIASGSPGLSIAEELVFENGAVSRRISSEVLIAIVPADDGADALGLIGFGGWNDCPFPVEHVAAWRHWQSRYGAEVVGVSGDVINARARERPKTRYDALALALEQFEYCSDIVHQGVGTLDALAANLMADDWWYFWWD